eukprot:3475798-Pyramimonas_sp.AAC.1
MCTQVARFSFKGPSLFLFSMTVRAALPNQTIGKRFLQNRLLNVVDNASATYIKSRIGRELTSEHARTLTLAPQLHFANTRLATTQHNERTSLLS